MILERRRVLHFSVKYSSCPGAFFRSIQGKIPRLPLALLSNAARDDFGRRFIERDGQSHHHQRDKGSRRGAQWTALRLCE